MELSWRRNVAFVFFLLHMTQNTRNQHVQIRNTIFECSSSSCDKVTSGRTIEQREVADGGIQSIGAESVGARGDAGDKGDEWVSACGEGAAWDDRLTAALLARRRAQGLRADVFLLAASAHGDFPGGLREQRRLLRLQRLLHAQGLRGATGDTGAWLRVPIGQRPLALLPCGARGARLLREGPLAQVVQLAQVAQGSGALLLPLPPFAVRRLLEHAPLRFDSALLVASLRRRSAQAQLRVMEAWRAGEGLPLEMRRLEERLEGRFQRPRRRLRARADLRGVTFRAISGYYPVTEGQIPSNQYFASVFFGKVWQHIEEYNNFRAEWMKTDFTLPGVLLANGTWTGMIGALQRNEADVAVGDISVISQRKDFVDFTDSVMSSGINTYMRPAARRRLRWTDFLHPFRRALWGASVGAALLLAIGLTVALRMGKEETRVACRDAWFFVIAAFCQQSQRVPKAWSGRVLCVCAHLVALVLAAAHSGSLISALSTSEELLPFNSLREALDDSKTRFIFTKNSGMIGLFKNWKSNEWIEMAHRIDKEMERGLPADVYATLQLICEDARAVVFISTPYRAVMDRILPCEIVEVPFIHLRDDLAFTFTKANPYTQIFSYFIRRMRRVGVLSRVVSSHWPHLPHPANQRPQPSVALSAVAPLFVVLTIGALLSLILLILERRIHPYWDGKFRNKIFVYV